MDLLKILDSTKKVGSAPTLYETGGEKYERYARAYDEYMESSFIGMMGAEDETGEEICTGMMM